jgi:hypothetical protein
MIEMKYRILIDKKLSTFYPQRKRWVFWHYYDGSPFMNKRYGQNITEAIGIIEGEIKEEPYSLLMRLLIRIFSL